MFTFRPGNETWFGVCLKTCPSNKYGPRVNEAELINANQNYAVVRYPKEQEVTVSAQSIAATTVSSNENDLAPFKSKVRTIPSNDFQILILVSTQVTIF